MTARFQRHVSRRTFGLVTGSAQGMDLGVRLAGLLVPAFADDLTSADQDATNPRIGRRRPQASLGELQGTRHQPKIVG
jgi:hypothetical protein